MTSKVSRVGIDEEPAQKFLNKSALRAMTSTSANQRLLNCC
jgi:hypothetical protein